MGKSIKGGLHKYKKNTIRYPIRFPTRRKKQSIENNLDSEMIQPPPPAINVDLDYKDLQINQNDKLYYKIVNNLGNSFIITKLTNDQNEKLDTSIYELFQKIFPLFESEHIKKVNTCGPNARYICKNVKHVEHVINQGMILMYTWLKNNDEEKKTIESLYGKLLIHNTTTYHTLPYFKLEIDGSSFFIAIETTSIRPFILEFYVGNSLEELEQLIKIRYQVSDFYIADCHDGFFKYNTSGGRTTKRKRRTRRR